MINVVYTLKQEVLRGKLGLMQANVIVHNNSSSNSNTGRRAEPLAIPTCVFIFCFSPSAFYTIGH